jgi:Carboxypeptidase regulatory-like domain
VISGHVDTPVGPLGGVTVEATDGTITVSTVSLTLDDVGFFALRSLPTPGQYTVTFKAEGYSSETRTFDLGAEQQLDGVAVTLAPQTGSLSGTVSENDGGPLGGVTVNVSGADVQLSTTTASQGNVGQYTFTNLPEPATYTVTFSKPGFVGQTRLEDLDPQAGRIDVTGVDASLIRSTATIRGVVRNFAGTPVAGAALVLTDGTTTRELRSANEPDGRFEFSAVEPGTYTLSASVRGTSPTVLLVNVAASDVSDLDIALDVQASLFGRVNRRDAETGACNPWIRTASVRLFVAETFPHGDPVKVTTTDGRGFYAFDDLDAPEDFVVAVYSSETSADALVSRLVQTIPSRHRKVDPFCVGVTS